MAFGQLRPSPNKPRFYGKHFNKKSVVCKNFWTFFHEIVAPKKLILDRTNSVPWARIAIVFAEFAHNCITTAIFNCSCSMNFYNGFLGSTIWPPKTSFIWKISLVFNLVVIQPWHGPCHMCSAVPSQYSSSS